MEKETRQSAEARNESAVPAPSKKAYEPPAVIYRAPLEAMAAVCTPAPPGKAFPGVGGCTSQFS